MSNTNGIKSISDMTMEELQEHIKKSRANRMRTPPQRVKKAKVKKLTKLMKSVDSMSPEELAELKAKLTGGKDA